VKDRKRNGGIGVIKRGYCSLLKDANKNRKTERMLTNLITGAEGGMLKELFAEINNELNSQLISEKA